MPGRNLTGMTVTLQSAAVALFQFSVVQVGGPQNGITLGVVSVNSGQTSGTLTTNVFANAGTISYGLREFYGGPKTVGVVTVMSATVTFADAVAPSDCQYGYRASSTAPTIALITDAAITAALATFGAPWLAYLFAPLIGYALDTGSVCQTGPPAINFGGTRDLLGTINQKLSQLNSVMWWSLCECVPAPAGQPAPKPPTKPVLTQPPDFPVYGPYPCTNSDICSTLIQILKRLDELNGSQQVNNTSTTVVVTPPGLLTYKVGAVHAGLSGSGTITVSKLVGIRLEITGGSPGVSLEGNPPYRWDLGWQSVSDGGAMLQEQRITRTSAEWFPEAMNLATNWGYFFKGDQVATMTELQPA